MATNEFVPFGTGGGANVLTPSAWAALSARSNGFQAGIANSTQLNTAWRQPSFVAAMIGEFIKSRGYSALDNAVLADLLAAYKGALDSEILAVAGPLTPAAATSSFAFTPGAAFADFTGGATTSFSGPFSTVQSLTVPAGASYIVIDATAAFRVPNAGGEDCRTRIRYTVQDGATVTSTKYQGVHPAAGNQTPCPISLTLQGLDKTKSTYIELIVDSSKTSTVVPVYDPRIDVLYG